MLRAVKYAGSVKIGVTAPRLVEGDDGKIYVVKLKNNRLGTKVLVNEYIASQFAESVDLCFPPSGPIEFTDEFIANSKRMRRAKASPGLHFASQYIGGAKYVHHYHMGWIKNKKQIAGVMLFDHLMHNPDRTLNGKNMLIKKEKDGYLLYAIDNSHLFGSGRWRTENFESLADKVKVDRRRAYGALLKHYLRPEDFAPYIEQFQRFDEEKISRIVDSIPKEWLDDEAASHALKVFLLRRCESAALIAQKVMRFIPDIHRGPDGDERK